MITVQKIEKSIAEAERIIKAYQAQSRELLRQAKLLAENNVQLKRQLKRIKAAH